MRSSLRILSIVSLTAAAVFTAGAIAGLREAPPVRSAGTTPPVSADRQGQAIKRAQDRLRSLPRDHETWAALGVAYVERARVTADPSLYPKAEGALKRSMSLRRDNADAMVGLGALANARHQFAAARDHALAALALNAWDSNAYGVLADAYTQLGDAPGATRAVQRMLDLRPGLAAYARASYDLEQRGTTARAEDLMGQALAAAAEPADIAFCRNQLGDLAWARGDLAGASSEYAAGLAADPGYQPLLRGKARVDFFKGRLSSALAGAAAVAQRTPTPDTLLEYAQLLRLAGRSAEADRQLDLAAAAHRIFQANGGVDDLAGAQIALARGDAAAAVRLARAEFSRRPFAEVADVLGQALHAAGRDREAFGYARRAAVSSPRNAAFAYHWAVVALSLGDRVTARTQLRRVRELNPYFSPADGPTAARALAALEARS